MVSEVTQLAYQLVLQLRELVLDKLQVDANPSRGSIAMGFGSRQTEVRLSQARMSQCKHGRRLTLTVLHNAELPVHAGLALCQILWHLLNMAEGLVNALDRIALASDDRLAEQRHDRAWFRGHLAHGHLWPAPNAIQDRAEQGLSMSAISSKHASSMHRQSKRMGTYLP